MSDVVFVDEPVHYLLGEIHRLSFLLLLGKTEIVQPLVVVSKFVRKGVYLTAQRGECVMLGAYFLKIIGSNADIRLQSAVKGSEECCGNL